MLPEFQSLFWANPIKEKLKKIVKNIKFKHNMTLNTYKHTINIPYYNKVGGYLYIVWIIGVRVMDID